MTRRERAAGNHILLISVSVTAARAEVKVRGVQCFGGSIEIAECAMPHFVERAICDASPDYNYVGPADNIIVDQFLIDRVAKLETSPEPSRRVQDLQSSDWSLLETGFD